jgi:hypothetical protein
MATIHKITPHKINHLLKFLKQILTIQLRLSKFSGDVKSKMNLRSQFQCKRVYQKITSIQFIYNYLIKTLKKYTLYQYDRC